MPAHLAAASAIVAVVAVSVGALSLPHFWLGEPNKRHGVHALGTWGVVGPVDEVRHTPTAREFWTVNVAKWRPLVLRGAASSMPAAAEWDSATLLAHFGNLTVRSERAREDRRAGSQRGGMRLSALLERSAAGDDLYAVSNVPHPMTAALTLPPFLLCGSEAAEASAAPADGPRQAVPWATPLDEYGLWLANRPTSSQVRRSPSFC